MHGLGNDYVFVDCFEQPLRGVDLPALARQISDRHRGVGGDGLILIGPSERADVRMEIYNADGSRAEMCGNGIRCVGRYAYEHHLVSARRAGDGPGADRLPVTVETDAGVLTVELLFSGRRGCVGLIRADMGRPQLAAEQIPVALAGERVVDRLVTIAGRAYRISCVSMGNPHAVIFVDDLGRVDLSAEGRAIETAPIFPRRINVHFVRPDARDEVTMLSWERGSGATQSCASGAAAVCVAGALCGRTDRAIRSHLPGGELQICWADDDHVYLSGPAEEVFTGDWPL